MEENSLPRESGNFSFSASERWLTWLEHNDKHKTLVIYSVPTKQIVSTIPNLTPSEDSDIEFHQYSDSGDRLVVVESNGSDKVLFIYDTFAERRVAVLAHNRGHVDFAIHDASSRVCTLSSEGPGLLLVRLWNLRDGEIVLERQLQLEKMGYSQLLSTSIKFSHDGSYLILGGFSGLALTRDSQSNRLSVLRTSDLEPDRSVLRGLSTLARRFGPLILWAEEQGTNMWNSSSNESKLIENLRMDEDDSVHVSRDQKRLIMWRRPEDSVELWDLSKGQVIAELSHQKPLTSVLFTVDDTGVALWGEGDVLTFFDAIDGESLMSAASILMPASRLVGQTDRGEIFYERSCRRFNVWNRSGEVLRYIEGRKYFGQFVPSRSCK
jgi:WD40 repeat protein